MRRLLHPALLAALLVLMAGCTAGVTGDIDSTAETTTVPSDGVGMAGDTGTVAFYLSDQPTAIGDFAHLNVTVTQVGFHPKGADNESDNDDDNETDVEDDGEADDGNETEVENHEGNDDGNETAGDGDEAADGEFGGWIIEPVDNRTVDLTTLVGDNATQIAGVELPAGEYNGVFIWVSEINGTLTDGSHVEVKLPSERLKLNTHFTVAPNSSVDFVFDIAVHETGNGRYILRPVISESGTDVPINPVDGDDGPPEDRQDVDDEDDDRAAEAKNESEGGGQGQGEGQGQDD